MDSQDPSPASLPPSPHARQRSGSPFDSNPRAAAAGAASAAAAEGGSSRWVAALLHLTLLQAACRVQAAHLTGRLYGTAPVQNEAAALNQPWPHIVSILHPCHRPSRSPSASPSPMQLRDYALAQVRLQVFTCLQVAPHWPQDQRSTSLPLAGRCPTYPADASPGQAQQSACLLSKGDMSAGDTPR